MKGDQRCMRCDCMQLAREAENLRCEATPRSHLLLVETSPTMVKRELLSICSSAHCKFQQISLFHPRNRWSCHLPRKPANFMYFAQRCWMFPLQQEMALVDSALSDLWSLVQSSPPRVWPKTGVGFPTPTQNRDQHDQYEVGHRAIWKRVQSTQYVCFKLVVWKCRDLVKERAVCSPFQDVRLALQEQLKQNVYSWYWLKPIFHQTEQHDLRETLTSRSVQRPAGLNQAYSTVSFSVCLVLFERIGFAWWMHNTMHDKYPLRTNTGSTRPHKDLPGLTDPGVQNTATSHSGVVFTCHLNQRQLQWGFLHIRTHTDPSHDLVLPLFEDHWKPSAHPHAFPVTRFHFRTVSFVCSSLVGVNRVLETFHFWTVNQLDPVLSSLDTDHFFQNDQSPKWRQMLGCVLDPRTLVNTVFCSSSNEIREERKMGLNNWCCLIRPFLSRIDGKYKGTCRVETVKSSTILTNSGKRGTLDLYVRNFLNYLINNALWSDLSFSRIDRKYKGTRIFSCGDSEYSCPVSPN